MVFKVIALIEMTAFYICYFGKMLSQKRKGIRTDQMGRDKSGFVKWVEVSLKVVTCLVPVIELVSIFYPENRMPASAQWCGAVIGAAGVSVFIISVMTMRDSWRAGVSKNEKTALVTDGIYRISRNPAFLGFDLMYIGILLMFFNPLLFAVSAAAMVLFHLQIVNVEEEYLLEAFGAEYLDYRKKVCRYIGRRR